MTTITPTPAVQTQAPAFRGKITKAQQKVVDTVNKAFRENQLKEMIKTDPERAKVMMMNDFSIASVMKLPKQLVQKMQRFFGLKGVSKELVQLNPSKEDLEKLMKTTNNLKRVGYISSSIFGLNSAITFSTGNMLAGGLSILGTLLGLSMSQTGRSAHKIFKDAYKKRFNA